MSTPTFSIVIPTYNRPEQLRGCLLSLAQLDYPRDQFDVIVVDDGSPHPLDDVVHSVTEHLRVTLIRQDNAGPGRARNTGAAAARGYFLAFTDDDCRPEPNWLQGLGQTLVTHPECMVGGHTRNRLRSNLYSVTSQLIVDVVYAHYNDTPDDARFFASNNIAVPAQLFRELGGFDTGFFRAASEDRELCDRWRHLGNTLIYAPSALVWHEHHLSLRTFCKQHFTYGRGALRYHQLRHERGSGHMREDMRFHRELVRLVRRPLAQLPRRQLPAVIFLLGLWQLINTAGFFYEKFIARHSTDSGSGR